MITESKIGPNLASLANYTLRDALNITAELGFETVEIAAYTNATHSQGYVPGFWFDELSGEERGRLRRMVSSFSHLGIHAPFVGYPLFACDEWIEKESRRRVRVAIDATAFLDGSLTVIHANPRPNRQLHEYWDEMIQVFREIGDYAMAYGVRVGIETGFPDTVENFVRLIEEIDHDYVGATLDVGHLLTYIDRETLSVNPRVIYNDLLLRVVRLLGEADKLFHIHLHDVREKDLLDHRALGSGIIDFPRLFKALMDLNYDGLLIFEFEEPDKIGTLIRAKRFIEDVITSLKQGSHHKVT